MADTTYTATKSSPGKSSKARTARLMHQAVDKPRLAKTKMTKRAASSSPVSVKKSKVVQPKRPRSESPEPSKLPKAAKPQNPTMLSMVMEAVKNNKSTKGISLQGIKRYITQTYPDTQESFSNVRLRKALLKGLERNEIIRPKSSEETGVKGYFLLNKTVHSQKVKQQALKAKVKKSVAGEADKQPKKKVLKVAKKKLSTSKSPTSRKPIAAKSKTPELKPSSEMEETKASSEKKVAKLKTKKASALKRHSLKVAVTPKLTKSKKAAGLSKRRLQLKS